jgi:hypothetical protein
MYRDRAPRLTTGPKLMYSNIDVQQQCFYAYDLSRRWYKIDRIVTHDAQVHGAHCVASYE